MQRLIKFLIIGAFFIFLSSCDKPTSISKEWAHLSSKNGDIPAPGLSTQQTASLVLDVDNNETNDFIIGCRKKGPSVLFYRRIGTGWAKYIVENDTLPVEAGGAYADIDEDGDLDIVFGADVDDNKIWWWENPYPNYQPLTPWVRRVIKQTGQNMHHDQIFADVDGDGDLEFITWNQGRNKEASKLLLAEIPSNPKKAAEWKFDVIYTDKDNCEGLTIADINQDGKNDIIGGGRWFKHKHGLDYEPHEIDLQQKFGRVAAGQLVAGGAPEVVFVIGDGHGRLKWYRRQEQEWIGSDLLGFDVDHGHSLQVADMNGDGKADVFCGEMRLHSRNKDATNWIFLGNGRGEFQKIEISKGFGVHEAKVGDLDGDGQLDILGKPYDWDTPRLDIWINDKTAGIKFSLDRWSRRVIDSNKPWRSIFITSADMNNDGKRDLITGGWWYKNPGWLSEKWKRNSIGSPLYNMALVHDFDGDGSADILGTEGKGSDANDNFVWAQNDGSGSFKISTNIQNGDGDFLQGLALGNFGNSKSQSIALSWHASGRGLQMLLIPPNPLTQEWVWHRIHQFSQDECLSAGDIDQDGFDDLLLGTKWIGYNGMFWQTSDVTETDEPPDRNRLADINGDGRLDAIVGYEAVNKIGKLAWYEHTDKFTALWKEHLIAQIVGPMSLDAADMDGDGDVDVVAGEHNMKMSSEAKLYIFENSDGKGRKWKTHIVSIGDEHHDGAQITDLDGDGDLDICSIGWGHNKVIVYENEAIKNVKQ